MTFSRVPKSRAMKKLILFLGAVTLWATPQQVTLSSTNKGKVTLPASAPYSTLATFHIDWRVTVSAAAVSGPPAWSGFSVNGWSIFSSTGYTARPFQFGSGFTYLINDYQDAPNPSGPSSVQFQCPTIAFSQDTVLRVSKFPTFMTCETWNVDGSNYQVNTSGNFRAVSGLSGNLQIGDATYNQGTMAFFRGYSGTVALASKPPFGSVGGDLWDYEFNGNSNDSSSHSLTLQRTGTFSYSAASTYAPACILPSQTTFRAGMPVTGLTGTGSFPLDGGETLSYTWQQSLGNLTGVAQSSLQFSSQTASAPTIQGLISGSFTVQLTVMDASGQSTKCSQKYGAVATDANGSVIIPNPIHAQILGPLTAIFASPWAAEPQQHIAYGNLLIQKLAGTTPFNFWFIDYWNQALPGTITVTNGSQTVTGVGTSFTTQFCQGPANPTLPKSANSTAIVVWYPILNPGGSPSFNGGTGRRFGVVTSCTDDTHLTAAFPSNFTSAWQTDSYVGAGSGLSYAYSETQCANVGTGSLPNCVGVWNYGVAPASFYENEKGLYALYYRTGIDDYLIAARTLADRRFSFPQWDKGISFETSNGGNPWANILPANRVMSVTGLIMRNADNPPYDYGPGIRAAINYLDSRGTPSGSYNNVCATGTSLTTCGQDVREGGYALQYVAEDYLYVSGPNGSSPDTGQAAFDLAALSRDMTNRWGTCQSTTAGFYPNGICTQGDYLFNGGLYSSWNGGGYAVSVTNGSPTVTAVGGAFDSTKFTSCFPTACSASNPPNAIWITSMGAAPPSYPSQGDGNWYYVVCSTSSSCGATSGTLTLTDITGQTPVNYTGVTKSGTAGFQTLTYGQAQAPSLLGFFWQPYMTGILNQAYYRVAQALAVSDPTNAANAAVWALNNATAFATIGLNTTTQDGFVTNGPYYAVGLGCPANGPGPTYPGILCDEGLLGDRSLNNETLNVARIALQLNPSSTLALNLGNTMMASMYAQPGEPGYDGINILSNLVNPGFFYTSSSQHKFFGQFWGEGNDEGWYSTTQGGLRPPIPRVVQVALNFQTASQAVLTVTRPDGTTSQVTCTSTPCPVTIDARQGDHILSIKYLNPANQVLIPAEQTIIKAQ
jgi:hypothetical protein